MSNQTKSKNINKKSIIKWLLIITALLTAAALITVSIVLINKKEYPYAKDPIAKIKLDNGMELLFELYDDEAPLAVGNFVYRANHGYYSETIIHNYKMTSSGGLFLDSGVYVNKNNFELKQKFILREDMKYTIKKESNSYNDFLCKKYYLSTINLKNGRAGSEFRICINDSGSTSDADNIYGVILGYPYDKKTKNNLDLIYNSISADLINGKDNNPSSYITIIGIEILTDKDYWKKFDYKKEWTKDQDYFLS